MIRSLTRRSLARRSAILFAIASATGCGNDAGTNVRAAATGTYQLTSVNGVPLPFVESSDATQEVRITAAQLQNRSDGSFTQTTTRSTTTLPGGAVTTSSEVLNGTYTVGGDVVAFTYSGGQTRLGSLAVGGGISILVSGDAYLYTK
jgi:hypothetical protein